MSTFDSNKEAFELAPLEPLRSSRNRPIQALGDSML